MSRALLAMAFIVAHFAAGGEPLRGGGPESAPAPAASGSSVRLARARDLIAARRDELHIPGLAFIVVDRDRIVPLATMGLRDRAVSYTHLTLPTILRV